MKKPTILVVDDDPGILRLVADALEGAGYDVRKATGMAEALGLADRIDLLLSDVEMPGRGGGPALAAAIGAPVVFMSGSPEAREKIEAYVADYAFLAKPFRLAELLETVAERDLFAKPQQRAESACRLNSQGIS